MTHETPRDAATQGPYLRQWNWRFITYSQQPATYPYPEPDDFNLHLQSDFFKNHFNITLPSTPRPSK